jgi:hypothetical protein
LLDIVDAINIKNCLLSEWDHSDGGVDGGFLNDVEEYIFEQQNNIIRYLNHKVNVCEERINELFDLYKNQQKMIDDLTKKS